jgi:hypothetical protein
MTIQIGQIYTATFPRGMGKTDFNKCLSMARRYGRFAGGSWTIKVTGHQVQSCVTEMAARGAVISAA